MATRYIQDVPTPHGSKIIDRLRSSGEDVVEYYNSKDFQQNLYKVNSPVDVTIYKNNFDFKFLNSLLFSASNERIILVGWLNINTKLLLILLPIFGHRIVVYSDLPNPYVSSVKKLFRRMIYFYMRFWRIEVWCLGNVTVDFFSDLGFSSKYLKKMLLFDPSEFSHFVRAPELSELKNGKIELVCGGRLNYLKGVDLLLDALSEVSSFHRNQLHLTLFADDNYFDLAAAKISSTRLSDNVTLSRLVGLEEYLQKIADSDYLVQPSRFDAFGAASFAYSLRVPIIGTKTSGAVIEYVDHGTNGYVYDFHDKCELIRILEFVADNGKKLQNSLRQNAINKYIKEQKCPSL